MLIGGTKEANKAQAAKLITWFYLQIHEIKGQSCLYLK